MKQITTNNGDFDIATEQTVLTYTLDASADAYDLKAEIRAGDGTNDLSGGDTYTIRGYINDGGTDVLVFESGVVVPSGTTRRIFDVEFFARGGETVKLTLQNGSGSAETVDVTTYLYTGVNIAEISEDETAADNLEAFLDGTGGVTLKATKLTMEQLVLEGDSPGAGALHIYNYAPDGYGIFVRSPNVGTQFWGYDVGFDVVAGGGGAPTAGFRVQSMGDAAVIAGVYDGTKLSQLPVTRIVSMTS